MADSKKTSDIPLHMRIAESVAIGITIIFILLMLYVVGAEPIDNLLTTGFSDLDLPIVAIETVPCLDTSGNEIQDIMCTKKITCSNWGIAGDRKCKT